MLIVLDSNEYIFSFGILKKSSSSTLVDAIVATSPIHSIRIPRLIAEEVHRHLTPEEFREFIGFVTSLTAIAIDEDFVVPFELGAKYESFELKPADAFIAAYVEWTGAEILITENRQFLKHCSSLRFKVLSAKDFLKLIIPSQ